MSDTATVTPSRLAFHGGTAGALASFGVFLSGVAWLGLSGAPDERGFWPVLVAALAVGLVLARDRTRYAEAVIEGMSGRIVMIMVSAWLLAGMLGAVLGASGLVDGLIWLAARAGVGGGAYAVVAFLICVVVSTATGTSFGTIIVCGPLLYPAAASLGADPVVLVGAILGGATFGDNVSPVSDTTIASATTQGADIGGVVRSRLRYALPAAGVALIAYGLLGGGGAATSAVGLEGNPAGLIMLVPPALVVAMLLRRRHLVEGLLAGIAFAVLVALVAGRVAPRELLFIDAGNFGARGVLVEGMERGVGASIFTVLLMGLVGTVEAAGVLERVLGRARPATASIRAAEASIVAAVSAAVLLTTHSVVAILATGRLTERIGTRAGIDAYRRANLLDLTVCTYPFLFPFFIPTILAASTTASGADFGLPRVAPLAAGLHNFHSWALLGMVVVAVVGGYGRR